MEPTTTAATGEAAADGRVAGRVVSHMTMSVDGYIADDQDRCIELFEWYDAGDVEVPSADPRWSFRVDPASATVLRASLGVGALVCGRRLFDITRGWGGRHPTGAPVVVVTHRAPSPAMDPAGATFVSGVAEAIATARELAGELDVVVASADIASQALAGGLLDEIHISLAPVVLGSGIPYFARLTGAPYLLDDPEVVVGRRATHLRYVVRR